MLPEPDFYKLPPEVTAWCKALIAELERYKGIAMDPVVEVLKLPPPDADGLRAFARDATGGGVPVYSRGGVWRRHDTNEEVT